jgi:hypothetical protein
MSLSDIRRIDRPFNPEKKPLVLILIIPPQYRYVKSYNNRLNETIL